MVTLPASRGAICQFGGTGKLSWPFGILIGDLPSVRTVIQVFEMIFHDYKWSLSDAWPLIHFGMKKINLTLRSIFYMLLDQADFCLLLCLCSGMWIEKYIYTIEWIPLLWSDLCNDTLFINKQYLLIHYFSNGVLNIENWGLHYAFRIIAMIHKCHFCVGLGND